jgi:class 3 adenylate cyclase
MKTRWSWSTLTARSRRCPCAIPPVPLRQHAAHVPAVLERMTLRLLSKDAEDRYQSARGLRVDLQRCLDTLDHGAVADFELGVADVVDQFRISRRLYGREEPLDKLHGAFRAARRGVQVVLVAGAPGVGKSALIREISKPIAQSRGYFVEGKFDQFERDRPYASLVQAFQQLVRQLLTESSARVSSWASCITDELGPNVGVVTDVIPEVALILGPQPPPPTLPPAEARHRFDDTFRRFVRIFARADAPLALFLDDLQWVDSASLSLLRTLATDPDVAGLMLVGTYRDNEVDPQHPLVRTIEQMHAAGVLVHEVTLGPLSAVDVGQLLCDSLRCGPTDAAPLAELLLSKTGGNPFFLGQFLRSLHAEGLLEVSEGASAWTWDIEQIEARDITDNVAELLTSLIRQLPDDSASALQLAACLGNNVSVGDLAEASGMDVADVGDRLWPALKSGYLLPVGGEHRWLGEAEAPSDELGRLRVRFLHDRVQQAAYNLLDEPERRPIHLAIARRLHGEGVDGGRLFAAARHYGAAEGELATHEREPVAALHLKAARKARGSNAYGPARQLLERGLRLADSATLRRDLETERGVCAYLLGQRTEATAWFERALAGSPDPLDRADIRAEWIQALLNDGDHEGVVNLGMESLRDLGRPAPEGKEEAIAAGMNILGGALAQLGPRGAFGVLDLPSMTDRRSRCITRTLGMVSPSAYIRDPETGQFLWVAATSLALAQEAGAAVETAHGLSLVGMVLYVGADRGLAHAFLEAAVALAERDGDPLQRARTATCLGFYQPWKDPFDVVLATGRTAWVRGLEAGEYFHAGWAAYNIMSSSSVGGLPPAESMAEAQAYVGFLRPRAPEMVSIGEAVVRKNLALMGRTDDLGTFGGPDFDADAFWKHIREDAIEVEVISAGIQQAWLDVLRNDWPAVEAQLVHVNGAFATLALFNEGAEAAFLGGLCDAAAGRPDGILDALERMDPWTTSQPANFGPRARLLEAELATLTVGLDAGITAFDRAIDAASDQPQIRALAQERAGRRLLGSARERFARVYLAEARNGYELWGATAKAEALGEEFPDRSAAGATTSRLRAVRVDETMDSTSLALPAFGAAQLDLETFARASRAIASEVELPGLLRALLKLAVENAGATAGALVTWDDDGPRLRGRAVLTDGLVITTVDEPLSRTNCVPRSVVLGVARLREPTIIEDTQQELRFARDPYFLVSDCRSALALPLMHGGRMSGVLYLENDQTTGAFTASRTELLSLLSSQVAIGLENARLYEETRAALEHVQKLNAAHQRFVPQELLAALNKPSVLEVSLGESTSGRMAVLFADIRGFTTLSEQLGAEATFGFLNEYLGMLGPVIRDCGGFIDKYIGDAIMAVFPGAADDALNAAVQLQSAVDRFNEGWTSAGNTPIRIGVGVHVGHVVLGTVGEAERMEGTVVSDAVNVASRLEGQCKALGVGIVASAEVFDACERPDRPRRPLGEIRVRGRAKPLTVFELVSSALRSA